MSESVSTPSVGSENGQVKWFNNRLGYGFITVITAGDNNAKDIFVHQSNIHPSQSQYRTLTVGEYVSLDISGDDKHQALNVTGINGGSLSCDVPRPTHFGGRGGGGRGGRGGGGRGGRGGRGGHGGHGGVSRQGQGQGQGQDQTTQGHDNSGE